MDAFGYKFQAEFEIFFNDEKTDKAMCIALEPPEKEHADMPFIVTPFTHSVPGVYYLAPELFVSEGTPGSIVDNWVKGRGGIGGLHHLAYQCDSVSGKMAEWTEKGYGEFTTKEVLHCPGLKQVFTKAHHLTGIIFEFIERDGYGFCKDNVKQLMQSTAELDKNIP